MATATTYPTEDAAFVRGLFLDWTPDPSVLPGWAGLAEAGEAIVPDPKPSGLPSAPTLYAEWGILYRKKVGDYEGNSAPIRYGSLVFIRYFEDQGRGKGMSRLLGTAILDRLDSATPPDSPLCFDLQDFKDTYTGPKGSFQMEHLIVPFVGD